MPEAPALGPARRTSLRRYLAGLIFLAAGPLVLLSGVMAVLQVVEVSRTLNAEAAALARTAVQTVDRATEARLSGLVLLSNARSLADPAEKARGHALAKRFHDIYGSPVIVAAADGQLLLDTRLPLGAPLGRAPQPKGRSALAEALATGRPAVGDAVPGTDTGLAQVALGAPIKQGDEVLAVALTLIDQKFFTSRLRVSDPPPSWSVRLLDSVGQVIGSSGPPVDGSADNRVVRAAVNVAPWQVEVQIPAAAYWQPMARAAAMPVLALLLATAAGLLGGGVAAARLRAALVALAGGDATERRAASGIAEVDGLAERLADTARGLRESERSYRVLFDAHPHPMWVVHPQTQRFLAVNDSAVRHYGYSRSEFLAMGLSDIRSPDESARMQAMLQHLGSQPAGADSSPVHALGLWTHRLKDGRFIQAEITSSLIEFEGQDARLVLAVDVTEQSALAREREAAREASARALAQLRDVLARVVDGFVTLDRDFVPTYANERAAALLGAPDAQSLVGRPRPGLLPDSSTTPFHLACSRVLLSGQPEVIDALYEPTGRWFENRIYASGDGLHRHHRAQACAGRAGQERTRLPRAGRADPRHRLPAAAGHGADGLREPAHTGPGLHHGRVGGTPRAAVGGDACRRPAARGRPGAAGAAKPPAGAAPGLPHA